MGPRTKGKAVTGPSDPADPMLRKVLVSNRDDVWSLWQVSIVESQHKFRILEQNPTILCK